MSLLNNILALLATQEVGATFRYALSGFNADSGLVRNPAPKAGEEAITHENGVLTQTTVDDAFYLNPTSEATKLGMYAVCTPLVKGKKFYNRINLDPRAVHNYRILPYRVLMQPKIIFEAILDLEGTTALIEQLELFGGVLPEREGEVYLRRMVLDITKPTFDSIDLPTVVRCFDHEFLPKVEGFGNEKVFSFSNLIANHQRGQFQANFYSVNHDTVEVKSELFMLASMKEYMSSVDIFKGSSSKFGTDVVKAIYTPTTSPTDLANLPEEVQMLLGEPGTYL